MKIIFVLFFLIYSLFFKTISIAQELDSNEVIENIKTDYWLCNYEEFDKKFRLSKEFGIIKYVIDEKQEYDDLRLKCNDILKKFIYSKNINFNDLAENESLNNSIQRTYLYIYSQYHLGIIKYSKNYQDKNESIKKLEGLINKFDLRTSKIASEINYELSKIFSSDIDFIDAKKSIRYLNLALINPENENLKNDYLSYQANLYDEGLIVNRDKKKALKYFLELADSLNKNVNENLGRYYMLGLADLNSNFDKSIKHYKKSKISSKANYNFIELDLLYSKQRLPNTIEEYLTWLENYVIKTKNAEGFKLLAIINNDHKRISLDHKINIFKWYYLSSIYSPNYEDKNLSKIKLKIMEKNILTTEQIEEAKLKANSWLKNNWF